MPLKPLKNQNENISDIVLYTLAANWTEAYKRLESANLIDQLDSHVGECFKGFVRSRLVKSFIRVGKRGENINTKTIADDLEARGFEFVDTKAIVRFMLEIGDGGWRKESSCVHIVKRVEELLSNASKKSIPRQ